MLTDAQIEQVIDIVLSYTDCASPTCTSRVSNNLVQTIAAIRKYLREEEPEWDRRVAAEETQAIWDQWAAKGVEQVTFTQWLSMRLAAQRAAVQGGASRDDS